MDTKSTDRAAVRVPPPLYFILCLGVGLILEYWFPIQLISVPQILRMVLGSIFISISGYFALTTFIVLIKNKTPFDPSKSTVKIVCEGSFKYSRNPMYLSLVLLQFGIAVFVYSLWLFILLPVLFLILLLFAIKPEEEYLLKKFGDEYLDYMKKVRRWI